MSFPDKVAVVVPWHNPRQFAEWMAAWDTTEKEPWLFAMWDREKRGCALTKNAGIRKAIDEGRETIIILDDDCFPSHEAPTLAVLAERHLEALQPQTIDLFSPVTDPPSRGTPYFNHDAVIPVAASMGFWTEVGDYDAPGQLVHGALHPMQFERRVFFGRYFPLCGMNLAFRAEWWPWCQFIEVPRFDDIWQGFLWQKEALRRGHCFNLNGPLVRHARQSNVWQNLRDEAPNLERNETLWAEIAASPETDYHRLRALIS